MQAARRLERARVELGSLEERIARGEEELEALGWRLGDPEVYRDADAVRDLEARRVEIRGSVETLYSDWERLAAEIEAAEDAP